MVLPPNTPPTRPALHRNDPERDGVYAVDDPLYQTLPFPPAPFRVSVRYDVPALGSRIHNRAAMPPEALPEISAPVLVTFADEKGVEQRAPAGQSRPRFPSNWSRASRLFRSRMVPNAA